MCMKNFHSGIKSSANPCRVFACVTRSQRVKALCKAGCQCKSHLSWLHTWARCWGFSEQQDHGKEGFCISCVLTPALNLQDLWSVNSVMNWPENIPRVKPIDNVPHSAMASYHLSHGDLLGLLPPSTVLQYGSKAGVIFHLWNLKSNAILLQF